MSRDFVAECQRNTETVREILNGFQDKITNLRKNENWSELGRERKISEAAKDALERIDKIPAFLAEARQALSTLRQSLEMQIKPGNEAVAELRAREIRDRLASRDPLEVRIWVTEQLEAGNQEAVVAVLTAPVPLLDKATAKEMRENWLQRALPEKVKEAEELAHTVGVLDFVVNNARTTIQKEAKLSPADPLFVIARTGVMPGGK